MTSFTETNGIMRPVEKKPAPKPLRWELGEQHESMCNVVKGCYRITVNASAHSQKYAEFIRDCLNGPCEATTGLVWGPDAPPVGGA